MVCEQKNSDVPPECAPATAPLIALLTFGTGGDLHPFLSMAEGLQRRGHRTLLIIPRFHEAVVQRTGLPYMPFGTCEQVQEVLQDPALWNERRGFGVVWRGLLPSLDVLQDILITQAHAGPCIVVSHPFLVPVAAMAREQCAGLRIVAAYLAPSSLRTVHDPLTIGSLNVAAWVPTSWRRTLWHLIDKRLIDPDLLPGLNAARASRGLQPIASYLSHMQSAGDASVGLFPPWFAPRQPDWPSTFFEGDFPLRRPSASGQLSAPLESFLAAGKAPIVFTAGTGHQHAAGYFRNALDALRALGHRGVFITAYPSQLPDSLPPQVLWQAHAPFGTLLPRIALLVHHGGIGTTAEALRAGVPQLIVPFAFDQFDNGRRVQSMGAGSMLRATRANARRLRQAIGPLLAGPPRATAQRAWPAQTDAEPEMPTLLDGVQRAIQACMRSAPAGDDKGQPRWTPA